MISSEQTSYNIALGGNNVWLGCLKLVGIGMLLPEKYKITVPDVPQAALKQVLQHNDIVDIRKWIEATQKSMYSGVQKFIEEEYKKGNLDF